jgi:hypothetical protein
MIDPELRDLWIPTGVLLGFQVTLFKWRLEREAGIGDASDGVPWLTPSDYMSIIGMLAYVIGVILLPVSGLVPTHFSRGMFGLGALLFVGQALGLAGHYQLFNRAKPRQHVWFPAQERVVICVTFVFSAAYMWFFFAH